MRFVHSYLIGTVHLYVDKNTDQITFKALYDLKQNNVHNLTTFKPKLLFGFIHKVYCRHLDNVSK